MPFVVLHGFGPDLKHLSPNFQMADFLKLHMEVFGSTLDGAKTDVERIWADEGLFRFEKSDNAKADFFVNKARKMGVSCYSLPKVDKVSLLIDNNEKWSEIRLAYLSDLSAQISLDRVEQIEKTLELLDACRNSRLLRHLLPYRSLGRLGLWRFDAYERGGSDDFVCLYFHQNQYTVSNYDNTEKRYFDSPKAAIEFVEQSIDKETPFTKATSTEV
jgi:hypothetical protein